MNKLPLLLLPLATVLAAADIDGSWRFNFVSFGEEWAPAKLDFKVDGDKLSGNLNEIKIEGTAQDGALKFTATRPNGDRFGTFEGRASGSELSGTARIGDDDVHWIARRAVLPKTAPQTRAFEP